MSCVWCEGERMTISDDVKSLERENARLVEAIEGAVNPDDLVLVREALQQVLQLMDSLITPTVKPHQKEIPHQEANNEYAKSHDQRYTVTEIGGGSEQQPAIYKLNSGDVLDGHTE